MIGCVAKASSYEIMVNTSEMEDVQWLDREELAAAVQLYEQNTGETMQSERGVMHAREREGEIISMAERGRRPKEEGGGGGVRFRNVTRLGLMGGCGE